MFLRESVGGKGNVPPPPAGGNAPDGTELRLRHLVDSIGVALDAAGAAGPGPASAPVDARAARRGDGAALRARPRGLAPQVGVEDEGSRRDGVPLAALGGARGEDLGWGRCGEGRGKEGDEREDGEGLETEHLDSCMGGVAYGQRIYQGEDQDEKSTLTL